MPESDDNCMTEIPHAVGIGVKVVIVGACGDSGDCGVGGINLDVRNAGDDCRASPQMMKGTAEPIHCNNLQGWAVSLLSARIA